MTVLKEGAQIAQLGSLLGITTVAFTVIMVGWILWAWWPSRREAMDAASRMPLEEEDEYGARNQ